MNELKAGTTLRLKDGTPITVKRLISDTGGMAVIYEVDCLGTRKALKLFRKDKLIKRTEENILQLMKRGSPGSEFVWPEAVTQPYDGTFGYVMKLVPNSYCSLKRFMNSKDKCWSSYLAAADAMLSLVKAMLLLHSRGLSFKDPSPGNIMINPDTGDLLVIDVENIGSGDRDSGIVGTPKYIAPEVLLNKSKPDVQSDRFSLAQLLFVMLCNTHPFEGRRYFKSTVVTEDIATRIYVTEPLFVFDKDNDDNKPIFSQKALRSTWDKLPGYLREVFCRAFSHEAVKHSEKRVSEIEWLDILMGWRASIYRCSCSEEFFLKGRLTACPGCKREIHSPRLMKLPKGVIPVHRGVRIYRAMLETPSPEKTLEPFALVVENSKGEPGLANLSGSELSALTPSSREKTVAPNSVIPFLPGIRIMNGKKTMIQFI